MIRAIAVDDEPLPLDVIDHFCDRFDFLNLECKFTQTRAAIRYLNENPVDLLFLDIQMPAISGIDFYKSLNYSPMVIFTTAHSKYAIEGFDLNAVDYLLKPYDFDRFTKAVEKARDFYKIIHDLPDVKKKQKSIMVRSEYSLVKIVIDDILYVEGLADYMRIHLKNNKSVVIRRTMKEMAGELPENFIRVHRSYIVSKDAISSVRNQNIFISDHIIPIGKTYKEAFFKTFTG